MSHPSPTLHWAQHMDYSGWSLMNDVRPEDVVTLLDRDMSESTAAYIAQRVQEFWALYRTQHADCCEKASLEG